MFKEKFKQKLRVMAVILTAVILFISLFYGGAGMAVADTQTSGYTSVWDDLHKDNSFNENNYPEVADDYSLQVIQIAESTAGELFVYVYQPSGQKKDLRATTIRFSTDSEKWLDYNLTFLNSNGVFYKYIVNDFAVKAVSERFYDIAAIYREWDKVIDNDSGNDNTIDEVVFAVAQLWTVCTINNDVIYDMKVSNVVEIRPDQKYLGYVRYSNGLYWYNSSTDGHYVAFDCNFNIDDIYSADISFTLTETSNGTLTSKSENKSITISKGDTTDNVNVGLLSEEYAHSRIVKVSDFLRQEDLTDDVKEVLNDKQWVFRFYETEYVLLQGVPGGVAIAKVVSNCSILRLNFISGGIVYNLGVVDSRMSVNPEAPPDNNVTSFLSRIIDSLDKIFAVISVILLVAILAVVFPPIWAILKKIFNAIVWVICLPFRLIFWIFKKRE